MAKDDIVEAEQQPAADSFMTGMSIFTTVALFAAFLLIKYAWGANYGEGMFSK